MWGSEPSRAPAHQLRLPTGQADEKTSRTGEDVAEEWRVLSILVTPNSPSVRRLLQVPVPSVMGRALL